MFDGVGYTFWLVLGIALNISGLVFLFVSIYRGRRLKEKSSPYESDREAGSPDHR